MRSVWHWPSHRHGRPPGRHRPASLAILSCSNRWQSAGRCPEPVRARDYIMNSRVICSLICVGAELGGEIGANVAVTSAGVFRAGSGQQQKWSNGSHRAAASHTEQSQSSAITKGTRGRVQGDEGATALPTQPTQPPPPMPRKPGGSPSPFSPPSFHPQQPCLAASAKAAPSATAPCRLACSTSAATSARIAGTAHAAPCPTAVTSNTSAGCWPKRSRSWTSTSGRSRAAAAAEPSSAAETDERRESLRCAQWRLPMRAGLCTAATLLDFRGL